MKAHEITSNDRLDRVLVKLCDMIIDCDGSPHSMVGAAVVDPDGRTVLKLGTPVSQDPELWCHAERTAIDAYHEQYGELPEGCVIVTTLSPCSDKRMELRYDESCTDLLEQLGIQRVYCGYMDPSQDNSDHKFRLSVTSNSKLQELCKRIGDAVLDRDRDHLRKQGVTEGQTDASNVKHVVTFTTSISPAATKSTVVKHYGRTKTFATREAAVAWANKKNQIYRQENKPGRFEASTITDHRQSVAENFTDGKKPGRKGLAKRSGVNTKASVSTLRNVAKHSTGEKQRMAHWLANMKAGRAKARKK